MAKKQMVAEKIPKNSKNQKNQKIKKNQKKSKNVPNESKYVIILLKLNFAN